MSAHAAPTTIPRAAPKANIRWLVIAWVFVIAAVSYLDRNNLSIAAGSIKAEFHLSDVQLGGVFSAFALGYALSQPIAGRVADAVGAYKVVAFAIVWWSLFTAATPLVPPGLPQSFAILLSIRCLLGVGEAIIFPAGARLTASWIPSPERGLASGLIFAGVGVGGAIAPPLITYVSLMFGWRWAFYGSALLGLAAGAAWLILVRDKPEDHPLLGAEELAYIRAGTAQTDAGAGPRVGWARIVSDRQVALLTASYFCYGYVAYVFFTWFFTYLSTVRGLNLKASALYATLPFLAMTLASILGGVLSDRLAVRFGKRLGRCGVAGFAMVLAALFVAMATQVADAKLAAIVLAGGAGALYLAQSAFWALSADIGGRASGAVSGVMNMGAQIGGVVTATATALIAHRFGWTASFLSTAAICLLGAVLWIFVDPHHRLALDPANAQPQDRP